MKQEIMVLGIILLSLPILGKDMGVCYEWSEGDAQHLNSCNTSSLDECSKGRKAITNKNTSFQNYKGKLFSDSETQSIFEFKNESIEACDKELIRSAREAEKTMCDNWGKAVYSTGLKVGDRAYVYGKSVNLRENANSKSKKIFSPEDRTEVKILEKSKEQDSIEKFYSAYWFKVSINGKTGWIYGQFLHPDPKSKKEFIE